MCWGAGSKWWMPGFQMDLSNVPQTGFDATKKWWRWLMNHWQNRKLLISAPHQQPSDKIISWSSLTWQIYTVCHQDKDSRAKKVIQKVFCIAHCLFRKILFASCLRSMTKNVFILVVLKMILCVDLAWRRKNQILNYWVDCDTRHKPQQSNSLAFRCKWTQDKIDTFIANWIESQSNLL